jgi:hypothetical protein
MHLIARSAVAVAAALAAPGAAGGQAVSPMAVSVGSHSDRFMVRLTVSNPYAEARRFRIAAYTPEGQPVPIWTPAPEFQLASAGSRAVTVAGPFEGAENRKVYVCAETIIGTAASQRVRGQVCSTVSARRLSS